MYIYKSYALSCQCKGNLDGDFICSALLVESNEKFHCPRHIDNNIAHQTDDMIKMMYDEHMKQKAKIIRFNSFDEKAKKIDKYALVIMPILFMVTSILYWTTHLRKG